MKKELRISNSIFKKWKSTLEEGFELKTKKNFVLAVLVIMCFALLKAEGHAIYTTDFNKEALTGLKTFELKLEMCDLPGGSTTEEKNQTQEERIKLQKEFEEIIKLSCGAYGIEVLTLHDKVEQNVAFCDADLHVRITDVYPLQLPLAYIYTVTTYVKDYVHPTKNYVHPDRDRNPNIVFPAIIWLETWTGIAIPERLTMDVRERLEKQIDNFVKDYLAANSQKTKPDQSVEKTKPWQTIKDFLSDWAFGTFIFILLGICVLTIVITVRKKTNTISKQK